MSKGNRRNQGVRAVETAVATMLVTIFMLAAGPLAAQTAEGQPQDLKFKVVNATTGEPVRVERFSIAYVTARANEMADFAPEGPEFIAPGIPIKDGGKYRITLRHEGVPYWWEKRGHQLVADTLTLYVFDVVPDLENVSLTGLTLVARRAESLLKLEYLLQVANTASPQVTVQNTPITFKLELPRGASEITATYNRGPEPTPIATRSGGGGRVGLDVPLTPGNNQIRLTAVVPWSEGMQVPVGSDLALKKWSVLAAPEWLEITGMELEENDSEPVSGYRRFVGPELEGGESLALSLASGEGAGGTPEDLFTGDEAVETPPAAAPAEAADGGGLPLPLIFGGILLIVVIIAAVKRR